MMCAHLHFVCQPKWCHYFGKVHIHLSHGWHHCPNFAEMGNSFEILGNSAGPCLSPLPPFPPSPPSSGSQCCNHLGFLSQMMCLKPLIVLNQPSCRPTAVSMDFETVYFMLRFHHDQGSRAVVECVAEGCRRSSLVSLCLPSFVSPFVTWP